MPRMNRGSSGKKSLNVANLWLSHRQNAISSLQRMAAAPASTATTIFVIAVALLLPMLLLAAHGSFAALLAEFRDSASLTLYLADHVSEEEARQVRDDLLTRPDVSAVEYISPNAALTEFETSTGLQGALLALDANPLPAALVLTPRSTDSVRLNALSEDLLTMEGIETVQLDREWIQRLSAIADLLGNTARVLTLVVALGLVFITGNTIRLGIENRREEIRVIKLVGGTDAYIARPFLYYGLFLGLFGAITALFLALIVRFAIQPSIARLTGFFDSNLSLLSFSGSLVIQVLAAGALLGWLAALLASHRYIRSFDY